MITGFQLKAAVAATSLTKKEVAEKVGLKHTTLERLCKTQNLEYLQCRTSTVISLQNFFSTKNIIFSGVHEISLINTDIRIDAEENALTRFQLVCSRAATGLTQLELSQSIEISRGTISNLEQEENTQILKNKMIDNVVLKTFFEHLGIVFREHFTISLRKDPAFIAQKYKKSS